MDSNSSTVGPYSESKGSVYLHVTNVYCKCMVFVSAVVLYYVYERETFLFLNIFKH